MSDLAALAELGRFRAVEADILLGRLAADGIEGVASGRGLASLYPVSVAVFVPARHLAAARRVVAGD